MGYQPATYTIIQRGNLFFIKEPGIETGPFRTLKKAEQEIKQIVNQKGSAEIVIARYNKKGEKIKEI